MAYNKGVDTDSLFKKEREARADYYAACAVVRRCHHCNETWIVVTYQNGEDHQERCGYCHEQLLVANRAWRQLRDELISAGQNVDTLDSFHKRLSNHDDNGPINQREQDRMFRMTQLLKDRLSGEMTSEQFSTALDDMFEGASA